MSRAHVFAFWALLLACPLEPARAQDEEPENEAADEAPEGEDFDGAGKGSRGDSMAEGQRSHGGTPAAPRSQGEDLARRLREQVARLRAEAAPEAEWYAASLLPVPTSSAPGALLAALDGERLRERRGSAGIEGPGGRTARYLGFVAALCRHGPRARALLALLDGLRPDHPWLASARPLLALRPDLDALMAGWARLGAPDDRAPRVSVPVVGAAREPWRSERPAAGGGVLTFSDVDVAEEPTRLATGTLVPGACGETFLVDAALKRRLVAPGATPGPPSPEEAPDTWDLLAEARRARRLGDEPGALRALEAAGHLTGRDTAELVQRALRLARVQLRVALVDDLARGAAASDVVRRLRELDAREQTPDADLAEVVARGAGLTERLATLADPAPDAAPWTRPDWQELGVEDRVARLTAALTAARGLVAVAETPSGGCFVFDDGGADPEDEELVPPPLRPLVAAWAELGWHGAGALVALLPDERSTRVVEAGRLVPWTVGEVAARLLVRLTGVELEDLGDPARRTERGVAFWEQHGPRGPRAWYLARLDDPACPDPEDAELRLFLRAQPALASAWLEPRLAELSPDSLLPWARLYLRAGAPLIPALEASLRRTLLDADLDVAHDLAADLAADPRFVAEREALCWRLALDGRTDGALEVLRGLPRPTPALVLCVAEGVDQSQLEQLPPGPARDLVAARLGCRPRGTRDLALASYLADPAVLADPLLLLHAVDTHRQAQQERPTLEGTVLLADALDLLGPRLTPELLDQASAAGLWLHRAYGARAEAGTPGGAAARDAIAAWWAGAATRVARVDRGPCLPAPLVEPLTTTLDADTLAAALGTLEERGRFRAQVAVLASPGRGGLDLLVELVPRPEEDAAGWWALQVEVLGPDGEVVSTTSACTAEPTERWVRPVLKDALAALRATPGARLLLHASPP